ncbi:hypothetical protein HPB47_021678 [Ixodes persulcatus]|uniref:Uncharacterized protein n=1 Tax=Ixodes persulcatus TaxID=34615 RepID=A0AC60QD04_IXOPE|nr:hypothetical protein HPB47_021678 [Ixodes persulcatus]
MVSKAVATRHRRSDIEIQLAMFEYDDDDLVYELNTSLTSPSRFDRLLRSRALRVGFNSLGGFASVNHQHYHLYYLEHRLHLETVRVTRIFGEYHELQDYPAEGFAFQVSRENKEAVVRHIMALVGVLLETSTAHNLFVTRGTAFREGSVGFSVVRVYLWARKSCYDDDGFCSATEDSVAAVLRDFCHETFVKVRAKMASLEKDSEDTS